MKNCDLGRLERVRSFLRLKRRKQKCIAFLFFFSIPFTARFKREKLKIDNPISWQNKCDEIYMKIAKECGGTAR